MNRIPKYRAWDKTEKKWAPKHIVGNILYELQANKDADVLDSYDLSEYTGFINKDGKEIFEGDIIKMTYPSSVVEIGQVKWWDEYGIWATDIKSRGSYSLGFVELYEAISNKVEIIGNVFEHPNLIPKNEQQNS